MVPPLRHPIVQWLLPSSYRLHENLRHGKRLMNSLVDERRKREAVGDTGYERLNDVLQWIIDAAVGENGEPNKLAHRQLLLTIASIHTTTMAATHTVYDLCANPQRLDPLDLSMPPLSPSSIRFKKQNRTEKRKIKRKEKKERNNNIRSTVSFNRIVKEPVTLSDGVHLPRDTLFFVASAAILKDPTIIPNPEIFDPLRSYRKCLENLQEANRHRFSTTIKNDLHFGHGKYACPGRLGFLRPMRSR